MFLAISLELLGRVDDLSGAAASLPLGRSPLGAAAPGVLGIENVNAHFSQRKVLQWEGWDRINSDEQCDDVRKW